MTIFNKREGNKGFNHIGGNAKLSDFVRERSNDVAVIDKILEFNKKERNVTGLRTIPSSETDTAAGDVEGDYINDISNGYRYELIDNNGTLQWIRHSVTTSF